MQTLYGLTEQQMWEVYEEYRTRNWELFIKEIAEQRDDCTSLGDGDFGEIALYALEVWDASDRRADLEYHIADTTIDGWLSVRNKEE